MIILLFVVKHSVQLAVTGIDYCEKKSLQQNRVKIENV